MLKHHKIGDTIAKLRKEKGWTQSELAQRICISDKAVSKWESNKGTPSIEYLPTLAELFDVTLDYLMSGKEKEEKVVAMSRIELYTKNSDIKALEELSMQNLISKDEYGKDIVDYIIKYKNKKVLTKLLERVPLNNYIHAGESRNSLIFRNPTPVIELLLQFDMLDYLEKDGLFNCVKKDTRFHSQSDELNLYSLKMIKYIAKENLSNKFWDKYLSAHENNLSNPKSAWNSSYTNLLKELINNQNKDIIKIVLNLIININNQNFMAFEKAKLETRNNYCAVQLVFSDPWESDIHLQCNYFSIIKLDLKTLISLLDLGFKQEVIIINNSYKKYGIEFISEYEINEVEIKKNSSLSEIEKKKLLCVHNGIINIDELLQIKNYKIVKNMLETYPICIYEAMAKFLDKKNYKEAFRFAIDKNLDYVAEKIQNKEYDEITLSKKLSYTHPCYKDEQANYKYFIKEDGILENEKILFTGAMAREKTQILNKLSSNLDAYDIISKFDKQYFLEELKKGHIEMIIINLCVRLEAILKCNYCYEGDFSEMLKKYCDSNLVIDDENDKQTIDMLNKLRIKRNNIVHSEKTKVDLDIDDVIDCINYICNLEIKED